MFVSNISSELSTQNRTLPMAHSYTPGLTVTEHTTIRRRRMLPLPGSVLVAAGETVRRESGGGRAELPGKVYPLNLANQLRRVAG